MNWAGHLTRLQFADPWYLLLLLMIPLLVVRWLWLRRKFRGGLVFPQTTLVSELGGSWTLRFQPWLILFKLAGIALLVVAFARPQLGSSEEDILTEGVDIMVTVDVSGSMAAEDFRPRNRLVVAKQVIQDFVRGRQSDRIGLVIFAARSFTKCPLTIDYDVLLKQIEDVELGVIDDGTAIGSGLANAVNRLRSSKAKSRVIILLTDGVNNSGEIDPLTAAELARSLGVKVYTVGVGREGIAPFPVNDPIFGRRYVDVQVQIDEELLKKISESTGGQYFRSVDKDSLEKIFKTIDSLEKSKISVKSYTHYNEVFGYFLWPGLGLILVESLLSHTRFRKLP
jgi:Ca-activated chloride channel family protein